MPRNQEATAQWVNPGNPTDNIQVQSAVSTPILISAQVAPLFSTETPIENLQPMENLTTSSSSELSHDGDSSMES